MDVDPELRVLVDHRPTSGETPPMRTWQDIRAGVTASMALHGSQVAPERRVRRTDAQVEVPGRPAVPVTWFEPAKRTSEAAVVHVHGGGLVAGSVDLFSAFTSRLVALSGVPFLSVDYRLAPEAHGSEPAEDVFAALVWLIGHTSGLHVAADRVALCGESAGGGIAAGVAALARERGVFVAAQLLIQPMLDDRIVKPDPELDGRVTWTYEDDTIGWSALLGADRGTQRVPPVAAPARLHDLRGLPPAYIEVGALEIYRDPAIRYAQRLLRAGVASDLVVVAGAVHAFDQLAPRARLTDRVLHQRAAFLRRI